MLHTIVIQPSDIRRRVYMNVVIAIDSFKGSMTSLEAGESASAGIRRIYPDADIAIRPLADGGEGTVDALTLGCGGTRTQVCVTGPLEKPVLCSYGILDADKTAVIEMSGAAGITLLSETERNPLYTTTYGVGEVIRDAIARGCRHFIIGIGGSATNDGGPAGSGRDSGTSWCSGLKGSGCDFRLPCAAGTERVYVSDCL